MIEDIIVEVSEIRKDDSVIREVRFDDNLLFYEFNGPVLPGPLESYDFAVVALLYTAMNERRNLRVRGPVSAALLDNLHEFQLAWAKWKPGQYQPVTVFADREITGPADRKDAAVLAYSGGVDANFSLLRNLAGVGRGARNIAAAVLVHGFDIPLDNPILFESSKTAASRILDSFETPLTTVRTNWRSVVCKDWEMEFLSGLASCLFQFSAVAGYGLVGSDEDYASFVIPWSSNPVTNHFVKAGDFAIVTDGSGYTRSEKVRLIGQYPQVANFLRVCWAGALHGVGDENCGVCEKCVRTKLNFACNNILPGGTLAGMPTTKHIVFINAKNNVQINFLKDIMDTARKNGIRDSWLTSLAVGMALSKVMILAKAAMPGRIRRAIKKLLLKKR